MAGGAAGRLAAALSDAGLMAGRNARQAAEAIKRAGGSKLADKIATRVAPDTTAIGLTAAKQPTFVAEQGKSALVGGAKVAGGTAVGVTGLAVGVPAGVEAYQSYAERQTQEDITRQQDRQQQFIEDILSDDTISEEQKLLLLENLKSFTRPSGPDSAGLFGFKIPGLGGGDIGLGTAVLALLVLMIVLNSVRG
jgi:hypothetical protein